MKSRGKVTALAVLAILAFSSAPAAFASTLTVNLDPSTKVANITTASTTNLVFSYPANSTISKVLDGYNSTQSLSGSFNSTSGAVASFRSQFRDDDHSRVTFGNVSVSYTYNAKANSTSLVVSKVTDISASVIGAFNVTNGTVTADLGWRAFYISGPLNLDLEGRSVDVNLAGTSLTQSMGGRGLGVDMLTGMFGGSDMWTRPTLNFSSLSTPLSNWTKNYDALTNTTTFSKTIAGNSTFSARYNDNGQAYSITMTSDPSALISTSGYARASGNSLVISRAPGYLNPALWVEVAIGTFAAAGIGAFYFMRRAHARPSRLRM